MDGRQAERRFERSHFRIADATRPDDPAPAVFGGLERGLSREDPAQRGQRFRVETPAGFLVELAVGRQSGAAAQTARTLCEGDQLAQPQENVLIAGQTT